MDSKTGAQSYYLYNSSGSIQEIQDPAAKGPQNFFWNEEQWLSGVSNDLGVHHYVYDHKGERVMKSSVMHSSVQINDQNIDDIEYLEPYTLYINPYYVVTELKGGDKVSKHYYMNTQRVATDISINYQVHEPMAGPQQPNARDPKKPSEDTASVNYNAAFADLQATLNALGHQKLEIDQLGEQPTLEEYYPELVSKPSQNSTMAAKNAPESTTRILFWYHPDYLGNVDLVTERDGKTYEFFTYNPWGEEMHQYNANTFGFSSPYRFNSKEKDAETGLHYYGARYYQSKLSVWLSVDPLASERSWVNPYNFVQNNPITRIDPTGMLDTKYEDELGNTLAETNDGNNATVVVSNENKEAFLNDFNGTSIMWQDDPKKNQGWISKYTTPKFSFRSLSTSYSSGSSSGDNSSSGMGPSLLGAGLAVGEEGLSGSTFRLYNQKGTNFSPKLYSSGWGGGSAGQIKTYGTSKLTLGLNVAGKSLGLYNAYNINAQHSAGQIGSFQMFLEQGSNAYSTLGGIYGAAWGIGWEAGRAITNTSGYQGWKQDTWLPFRKSTLGY